MAKLRIAPRNLSRLPEDLRVAQDAINLPEVQEMLRKLAAHNLGICMPHVHDEATGEFKPLPDDSIQVEKDLNVSFEPVEDVLKNMEEYLSVGWFWRDGETHRILNRMWSCCVTRPHDTLHYKVDK